MNAPLVASFVYVALGMGATTAVWVTMPDELETALRLDVDDEDDLPTFRLFLAVAFVLGWPLLLYEVINRR